MTRDEEVEILTRRTLDDFGPFDILANNAAAVSFPRPLADIPIKLRDLMNVNM